MKNKTNRMINTYPKAILLTFLLSLYLSVVGEIIFYLFYYNDRIFEEKLEIIGVILVIFYSFPIVILYKTKQLLSLLMILVFTPICTVLSMFAAGKLFPLSEDDLGAGILGIFVIGYNYIFVFLGTSIGVVIKILLKQWRIYKEIPDS
ncbi:hypothetical protein [Paenibacillus sp. KS1]|uniref:hypothetical protein n=1 Tax=Paenibacillus sp. KS1 TaxID=1849249 RepID=UPI001112B0C9|nr:hypothetical protein [Paenibacillus sp. KS1]